MGKTVLVTGGAGFIGTNLCKRLVADGHRVISLDNYFTGSKENHIEGVEYREGHTKDIAELVPETPDVIYHLGEYSRVAKSLEEPALVFDLNMRGTFGVLEFWRARGSMLVYAGSSTKSVGAREDGTLGKDLAPYTAMKSANSDLVKNYGNWYGLPYTISYFHNVYGPHERSLAEYGTVVETFRQRSLAGKVCEVRSPGTQRRAFTHVDDIVEGLIVIAEKGKGEEFDIAANEVFTLLEVAEMFGCGIEMLPPTPTTRSDPGSQDTTALRALGWEPKKTLKEYAASAKA